MVSLPRKPKFKAAPVNAFTQTQGGYMQSGQNKGKIPATWYSAAADNLLM
jgi:hypothetical protein